MSLSCVRSDEAMKFQINVFYLELHSSYLRQILREIKFKKCRSSRTHVIFMDFLTYFEKKANFLIGKYPYLPLFAFFIFPNFEIHIK